jgi:hypothetical protein
MKSNLLHMPSVLEVTLRYRGITALFEPPAVSPFADDFHAYSLMPGVEYLAKTLAAHASRKAVAVTILLPPEQITPELEQQTLKAVRRYCLARRHALEQDERALRGRSLRGLAVAIVVLVIAVAVGRPLAANTSFIPELISEGLVFGSWVAIWFPLDSLVFGVWSLRLDAAIYRRLGAMRLTLKPDTLDNGDATGEVRDDALP